MILSDFGFGDLWVCGRVVVLRFGSVLIAVGLVAGGSFAVIFRGFVMLGVCCGMGLAGVGFYLLLWVGGLLVFWVWWFRLCI